MRERYKSLEEYISRGRELGLDIRCFTDIRFQINQVESIFNALKENCYVEEYAKPDITYSKMEFVFTCKKHNLDWNKYLAVKLNNWQLVELTYAIKKGYPYEEMFNNRYPHQVMGFINLRLDEGKSYKEFLDVDPEVLDYYSYAKENNFDFDFVLGKDLTSEEIVYYIENQVIEDGRIPLNEGLPEYSSLEEAEKALEQVEGNVRSFKELEKASSTSPELEVARMDLFS